MQTPNPIVSTIKVVRTAYAPAGYVIYTLQILGTTRFMLHPSTIPMLQSYYIDARYSDMLELSSSIARLILAYEPKAILPLFPPKKFFNNLSKEFLLERTQKIQEYFSLLLTNYGSYCQSELIQFCSPMKLNVVVCGSNTTLQQLFISTLAFAARTYMTHFNATKSFNQKSESNQCILLDEIPLVSCKSETALSLSPFMSKLSSYSQDFPLDYSYNDYLYRVDVEEAIINEQFHKEHYQNLLSRWADNNNSVIIIVNLSNIHSVLNAIQIIEEYQKIISKKIQPSFVIVGIVDPIMKQVTDGTEIKKMLISPIFCSYQTCYMEVDIKTGKGSLEVLNNLISRKAGLL